MGRNFYEMTGILRKNRCFWLVWTVNQINLRTPCWDVLRVELKNQVDRFSNKCPKSGSSSKNLTVAGSGAGGESDPILL